MNTSKLCATPKQAGVAALAGYEVHTDTFRGGYIVYKVGNYDYTQQIGGWWTRAEAWYGAWEHYQKAITNEPPQ